MTLFISDIKTQKRHIEKTSFVYLIMSLFCVLFGALYEHFSHEVYSGFMVYAFVFPLAGGTLPFTVLSILRCKRLPGRLSLNLYHAGISALTVGSLFEGVLEIYGTTNDLLKIYWIAGVSFVGLGLILYGIRFFAGKKT